MKRKYWIFTILLLVVVSLCGCTSSLPTSLSTGVCLVTTDGTCLLVCGNSPIVLSNRTGRSDAFSDLQTGDRLLVLHDGVEESYPARTGAYAVFRQGRGTVADIPQAVIDQLSQLGWTVKDAAPSARVLKDREFSAAVAWANYAEDSTLYTTSLNIGRMTQSSIRHLPLWQVSSTAELAGWKETFRNILTLDHGYDEVPSFDAVTADMDERFFKEQSVLLVYVPSNSCSYRYIVNSIALCGQQLCIHVQQANDPETGDCAMAGWLIAVTVPNEILEGITDFDADLNNLQD